VQLPAFEQVKINGTPVPDLHRDGRSAHKIELPFELLYQG